MDKKVDQLVEKDSPSFCSALKVDDVIRSIQQTEREIERFFYGKEAGA